MIEQYFRGGVRFLWVKPNDAMGPTNGAIVASAGAATPLTYDGLDGHQAALDPALLHVHVSAALGLPMHAIVPYNWLDYAPGRTARAPAGGNDILTGYMSGCLIVRGTFGGAMSTFHVGTITGNAAVNSTVKKTFAQNLPADATGFNPAGAWSDGEVAAKRANLGGGAVATERILALVTAAGTFHSILLFNVCQNNQWANPVGQRYWCVGGVKFVPAMSRVRLMAALMS